MTIKIQLTILFLFCTFVLQAQNRFERRGVKSFKKSLYPEAIANLKNVEEKNPEINRMIAESYFFLGDYIEAESYYQKIYDSEKSANDLLALSQIYLHAGNYEAAVLFSERAVDAGANRDVIDKRVSQIQELASKGANKDVFVRAISTQPKSKCLGIATVGNKIVFSNLGKKNAKGEKTFQLYSSEYDQEQFEKEKEFAIKLDQGVDVGAVDFSEDGQIMYYTRWYTKKGRLMMEILQAEQKNGKWKASLLMPFNSRKYSCAYPFISKGGKSIYFSSDMPGGYGGMDLYVSHKRGNSWGTPVNLGEEVNTRLNEIYPKILNDDQLWFASDGQVGYGKLDLFHAGRTGEGSWGNIENAGMKYNSSLNDFCIIDSPEEGQVLYVSDRNNKGIRDRIYSLGMDKKVPVDLFVKELESGKLIIDPKLEIKRILDNSTIDPKAISANAYQFDVSQYELGKGILYEIQAEKEGYEPSQTKYYPTESNLSVELLLKKLEDNVTQHFAKELSPIHYPDKRMIFRKIHFESGVPNLSAEAKKVLKKLAGFWKIYPELGIVINAHSDSRGSAEANKILSLKRAKMAVEYLIAEGVEQSKISYNAYGEQFIINGCVDGVECSESKHRENRRLELLFVVR